jgi:hypothetical protein
VAAAKQVEVAWLFGGGFLLLWGLRNHQWKYLANLADFDNLLVGLDILLDFFRQSNGLDELFHDHFLDIRRKECQSLQHSVHEFGAWLILLWLFDRSHQVGVLKFKVSGTRVGLQRLRQTVPSWLNFLVLSLVSGRDLPTSAATGGICGRVSCTWWLYS